MMRWTILICFLWALLATGSAPAAGSPEALVQAVVRGDAEEVQRQLEAGVSPDATDGEGTNALFLACDKEQPAVARLLIERGANVNLIPKRKGRSTPLQVAIYRGFDSYALKPVPGYPELIQALVEKGADVNAADVDGNTPLIAAAEKDDVQTVRLLVKRGADLAHTNDNGWTALERALSYRRRTIAREMVAMGAPLDEEQQALKKHYEFARKAGRWLPLIILGSFGLGALTHRQFKALPERKSAPEAGDDLPTLQPLKCGACGGSASLEPGVAKCANCHEPVPVPDDYRETLRLRERTFKLLERAKRTWKRVRIVSAAPVRWMLWIAAVGFAWWMWKGIFPLFVRDALYDLMTFKGTLGWALCVLAMTAIATALAGYAVYLGEVRKELPALPKVDRNLGTAESITCPNCSGAVAMKPHDLVGICGYCGSETYRVALAREAKQVAGGEASAAKVSLYHAMRRVYELRENAALAVPVAILVIGVALVFVLRVVLFFI